MERGKKGEKSKTSGTRIIKKKVWKKQVAYGLQNKDIVKN